MDPAVQHTISQFVTACRAVMALLQWITRACLGESGAVLVWVAAACSGAMWCQQLKSGAARVLLGLLLAWYVLWCHQQSVLWKPRWQLRVKVKLVQWLLKPHVPICYRLSHYQALHKTHCRCLCLKLATKTKYQFQPRVKTSLARHVLRQQHHLSRQQDPTLSLVLPETSLPSAWTPAPTPAASPQVPAASPQVLAASPQVPAASTQVPEPATSSQAPAPAQAPLRSYHPLSIDLEEEVDDYYSSIMPSVTTAAEQAPGLHQAQSSTQALRSPTSRLAHKSVPPCKQPWPPLLDPLPRRLWLLPTGSFQAPRTSCMTYSCCHMPRPTARAPSPLLALPPEAAEVLQMSLPRACRRLKCRRLPVKPSIVRQRCNSLC
jgi:hypothetical protein